LSISIKNRRIVAATKCDIFRRYPTVRYFTLSEVVSPVVSPFMYICLILMNLFSSWIKMKYCSLNIAAIINQYSCIYIYTYTQSRYLNKYEIRQNYTRHSYTKCTSCFNLLVIVIIEKNTVNKTFVKKIFTLNYTLVHH
jgi:hypothetical protein